MVYKLLPVLALLLVFDVTSAGRTNNLVSQLVETLSTSTDNAAPLPVVLWHGMGDSCCASYSMGAIKSLIEDKLPGTYVHSIATGESALGDVWSSYFGNINDQVARVCRELRGTPQLDRGFNAVGFSQGGQFLRAVAQRCQHTGPRMRTLVTVGAQHQGIANVPGCNTVPTNLTSASPSLARAVEGEVGGRSACETMQTLVGKGAYLPWVRDHIIQAQYFKDPTNLGAYLRYSIFLPDVNNEGEAKDPQYARNLGSLEKLVMVRFANDTTVVPRDSAWFGFWDGAQVIPLEEQALYLEDWIGLRALDVSGRLVRAEAPGAHMQFTLTWFEDNVLWPYLAGGARPSAHSAAQA